MSKKMKHQFACSSMMLPEHRGQLIREREEELRREELRRPTLDEQEQERFQRLLELSYQQRAPLKLTVLQSSGRRYLTGTVTRLEPWARRLRLCTPAGSEMLIIDDIIGIELRQE